MGLRKKSLQCTKHVIGLGLVILIAQLLPTLCYADEILFKGEGVQKGTVLEEDEEGVTIRFPRDSIRSIVKTPKTVHPEGKRAELKSSPSMDSQLQGKMDQLQKRIERLEKDREGDSKGGSVEQLLREEMGRVEGVILWKREPLRKGEVKIVLEKYTGFSWASLKKLFSGKREKSSDEEIVLTTQTDGQGRYTFKEAPPGHYRLYWMPAEGLEWVRRLREKPDFEIIAGKLTIQNIPEKKK